MTNLNLRRIRWRSPAALQSYVVKQPFTSPIRVVALDKPDPAPASRELAHHIQSYLVDVEQSLLDATVHAAQLEEALASRTAIGQAVGLLMAHEGLTADEAFDKLVHVSQDSNIKLRDIAGAYVDAWEQKITGTDDVHDV